MLRVMTVCLICLLPMWAFTQSDLFKGLAEEMTSAEREASGVGALSGEQQEFLDNWLRDRFLPTGSSTATPVGDVQSMGAATLSDVEQEKAIEAEVERRVNEELAAAEELEAAKAQALTEPFDAMIVGNFSGWSGKSIFALDNGQVWRQRTGSSKYRHTRGDNKVHFKKNFIGLWTMTVLSTGRSVGVRRID
jgi:hypothetical protein